MTTLPCYASMHTMNITDHTLMFVAEEIRSLRRVLGETQSAFALTVGVSIDTVRKWEQGKASPSPMAREKLQRVMGNRRV